VKCVFTKVAVVQSSFDAATASQNGLDEVCIPTPVIMKYPCMLPV